MDQWQTAAYRQAFPKLETRTGRENWHMAACRIPQPRYNQMILSAPWVKPGGGLVQDQQLGVPQKRRYQQQLLHVTGIGGQRAGVDADQRTFARAVGAQKAVKPWAEGQGDTGQGLLAIAFRAP